jgi:putative hydrolase of the HAD superfamily
VLVDCRSARPEHQASADWTELPAHIHHRTETLAPFLAAIGTTFAEETVARRRLRSKHSSA